MTAQDEEKRKLVLARLALSREEYRLILDPPHKHPEAGETSARITAFPRSRTMRTLLSKSGLGTLGAVLAAILVARPRLALKVWRMLPTRMVRRLLIGRALAALFK
jgi:hypothetical protein